MDILFGGTATILAILVQDGDARHFENVFFFQTETEACLRMPYAPCEASSCVGLSEDEFGLDITDANGTSQTILFSRQALLNGGERKLILSHENNCQVIAAETPIGFRISGETRNTIAIGFMNGDMPN